MPRTSRYLLTLFVLFSSVVYTANEQKGNQTQGKPGTGRVDERIAENYRSSLTGEAVTKNELGVFDESPSEPHFFRAQGDSISNPFVIDSLPFHDSSSTVGFTHDYNEACTATTAGAPDVVYELTLAADLGYPLIIDLCESYYDTKVYVYAAGNTSDLVACSDDDCTASHGQAYTSYLEIHPDSIPAGTYHIIVDGYGSSSSGNYVLDVYEDIPPTDPIYTALGSTIDFFGHLLGSTTTGSVLITNTGGDTLDISAVTVSGTGFSTAVDSLSIAVGDTAAIAVSFAPTIEQDYTGMLTFSTNDSTMLTDTIALSGYGVDAVLFEGFDADMMPPTGWTKTQTGSNGWQSNDADADGSGRCAYHNDDTGDQDSWLITPEFDLSSATAPRLSWWNRIDLSFYINGVHDVSVSTDSGITWTVVDSGIPLSGEGNNTWYERMVDVSTYAGSSSVMIGFHYTGNFADEWHIDDVSVAEPPDYPIYTALDSAIDFANNLLGSTITDSVWITNTGGDTLDISAVTVSGTGFSTAVDSLSIAVGDTAAIAVSFAPTIEQDYTGMLTFSTNDSTMLTDTIALSGYGVDAVFFEGFDADMMPPTGWTKTQTGSNGWQSNDADADGSGRCAYHNDDTGAQDSWLITPEFDLSSATAPRLSWWNRIDLSFYINGVHDVSVSTDSGITWTVVDSGIPLPGEVNNNWYERMVDLPTYAGSSSVMIGFHYTGTYADEWHIDDVSVIALPAVTISDSSGFRMMSSPVSGPIYGDLLDELWTQGMTGGDITSDLANVWTYSDTGWSALTDITSSGDTLTAGQGFLVYVFADTDFDGTDDLPVTLSISGTKNSGSITVPSTGSIADSAWALAGNPYASTIVWDSVTQTNVSATAYVWNNAIADYITWNGNTGDLSNGLIAPFQGFWVQGDGGDGSITILIADTSSTAGTFYKTMHDSTGSMSFTITADAYSDQAYVSFTNNGMAGMDNADAYKLLPLTPSKRVVGITYTDGQSLAINNLPYMMDDALAIPLDVMYLMVEGDTNFVTAEHPVTLTWDLSNLPETVVGLTLTDNITSDTYDLLNPEQDAIIITPVAKGSFSADGSGGVNIYPQLGDSHFTLTVAYSALSAEDESTLPKEFALHPIYPNPFNPSATISFDIPPVETYNNTLLRVYDIKGRWVATLVDAPYKPGTHTVQWHPQNLSSGLYIVQFKAGDKTFNQKITFIK